MRGKPLVIGFRAHGYRTRGADATIAARNAASADEADAYPIAEHEADAYARALDVADDFDYDAATRALETGYPRPE
jgi:NAD(P)-dependent dehydrogenase (short-subunit alcohol dehydrogenase family)